MAYDIIKCHRYGQFSFGGFYVVCDHGKHGDAKQYNLGVTFVSPLPVPKVTPKLVPFSENKLTI